MVLTRRGGGVDVLVAPAPAPAPQVFQATYSTAELEVLKGQQLRNIAKNFGIDCRKLKVAELRSRLNKFFENPEDDEISFEQQLLEANRQIAALEREVASARRLREDLRDVARHILLPETQARLRGPIPQPYQRLALTQGMRDILASWTGSDSDEETDTDPSQGAIGRTTGLRQSVSVERGSSAEDEERDEFEDEEDASDRDDQGAAHASPISSLSDSDPDMYKGSRISRLADKRRERDVRLGRAGPAEVEEDEGSFDEEDRSASSDRAFSRLDSESGSPGFDRQAREGDIGDDDSSAGDRRSPDADQLYESDDNREYEPPHPANMAAGNFASSSPNKRRHDSSSPSSEEDDHRPSQRRRVSPVPFPSRRHEMRETARDSSDEDMYSAVDPLRSSGPIDISDRRNFGHFGRFGTAPANPTIPTPRISGGGFYSPPPPSPSHDAGPSTTGAGPSNYGQLRPPFNPGSFWKQR